MSVEILFRDERFVVVNKPPKVLVHKTEIANGDTEFLLQMVRDQLGKKVWPLTRLDRGTSGAMIFVFSPEDVSYFNKNVEVEKFYTVVARGFTPPNGTIDHPLRPPEDPYLRVRKTESQEAVSHYKTLALAEVPVPSGKYEKTRLSLVSLWLETGRRHQIRRHLKWFSHPVIGDATYGKGSLNRAMYEYFGISRMLLHCSVLHIAIPGEGKLTVEAPLDEDFRKVLILNGWKTDYLEEMEKLMKAKYSADES